MGDDRSFIPQISAVQFLEYFRISLVMSAIRLSVSHQFEHLNAEFVLSPSKRQKPRIFVF